MRELRDWSLRWEAGGRDPVRELDVTGSHDAQAREVAGCMVWSASRCDCRGVPASFLEEVLRAASTRERNLDGGLLSSKQHLADYERAGVEVASVGHARG